MNYIITNFSKYFCSDIISWHFFQKLFFCTCPSKYMLFILCRVNKYYWVYYSREFYYYYILHYIILTRRMSAWNSCSWTIFHTTIIKLILWRAKKYFHYFLILYFLKLNELIAYFFCTCGPYFFRERIIILVPMICRYIAMLYIFFVRVSSPTGNRVPFLR